MAETTELFFTDARAKSAAVVDSILGSEHDQAPSVSAAKSYIDQEITSARAYTDTQLDALTIQQQSFEELTISSATISDGFVELDAAPIATPWVMREGIMGRPGIDFTMVDGVKVTFANEWAVGGQAQIEEGEKVCVW